MSSRPTAIRCWNSAKPPATPASETAALKTAILEQGIIPESADDLDGALGTSHGGRIRVLNGLSPATEFTMLVHEFAHLCIDHGYARRRVRPNKSRRRAVTLRT